MDVLEVYDGDNDSDFELDENILKELYKTENETSIKEELRVKIQQRRISGGQGELKVEFEPPKSYKLTPEEREKLEKRKERNRRSANKSRIKRQEKLENLEQEEKVILAENQRLRAEVDALQNVKLELETVVERHLPHCVFKDNIISRCLQDATLVSAGTDHPREMINLDAARNSVLMPESTANISRDLGTINVGQQLAPGNLNRTYVDAKKDMVQSSASFENSGAICSINGKTAMVVESRETSYVDARKVNPPCASSDQISIRYSENLRTDTGRIPLIRRNLDRTHLRSLSKEQKIAILKAYLKDNHNSLGAQKLKEQIVQMTRNGHSVQRL